jgi:predicted nuclease with TOPRIM domain
VENPQETPEVVVKSVEELTAEVERLTKELEFATSENERVSKWWRDLERKKEALEEYLDENWDDIEAEQVAEIMGIDAEVEKEVSVEISGTMTIKAPRGFDWDDISYSSFSVSIETNWSETFSIESYDLDVNSTDVQD